MAAMVPFAWDDPFNLDDQLTEDERMIRDAAHAFAQGELQPRVIENFSKEVDDPELFPMMGEAGLLGATMPAAALAVEAAQKCLSSKALQRDRIKPTRFTRIRGNPHRGVLVV